jgi:hypothetical protein
LRIDSEGSAKSVEPKSRLLGPAIALLVAARGADNDAGKTSAGASAGGNTGGRVVAGISGFGIFGAAASRASHTAGSVLGFYGLGWSVFSTVVSKGQEVSFEKNTPLEIRFGPPPAPPHKSTR